MAIVTKFGFTETAKLMAGETATAWDNMALGTGSAEDSTNLQTLQTEITASGLDRTECTNTVASSATASDTGVWYHTWTATGSYNVKEVGVFNDSTADAGDMLCYGTFTSAIPMESDDTLKITWSVQVKAG